MENRPHIRTGKSDFKNLITKGYYYVDKTDLIKQVVLGNDDITLFTRPRRFGKTLALKMLAEYFDITKKEENARLFDGLKIAQDTEFCKEHQNAYPVIFLSFKETRQPDFQTAFAELKSAILRLSGYIDNLSDKIKLDKGDTEILTRINSGQYTKEDLTSYPRIVTKILSLYYGKNVVVLLDEYDVPVQNAFLCGYYDEMIAVVRSIMSELFKDNDFLEYGVITGCLRITKESIFTGMNNFAVNTILTENTPEYFGFTPAETEKLLTDCGLAGEIETVRHWYDGYKFGTNDVYNPWSVLKFAGNAMICPQGAAQPYWMDTSGNDIFLHLVDLFDQDDEIRTDAESLIAGKPIRKKITESTTFKGLHCDINSIWSTLLFTGYLKPVTPASQTEDGQGIDLILPNEEVKKILVDKIDEWFEEKKRAYSSNRLAEAVLTGDPETAQQEISDFLQESISVRDEKEAFYHGVLTALLKPKAKEYKVLSNRESGNGYLDIVIKSQPRSIRVIIELKKAEPLKNPSAYSTDEWDSKVEKSLTDALDQAENQIRNRSYNKNEISDQFKTRISYAAAFAGKECRIRKI